jgi:hypothetical protein
LVLPLGVVPFALEGEGVTETEVLDFDVFLSF